MSSAEEKHKARVGELESEKTDMEAKLDSLTKNLEMINNTISADPAAAAAAAAAATAAATATATDPATTTQLKEAEAALETARSALAERDAETERLKEELARVRANSANDAETMTAKMSGKEELELQFAALQVVVCVCVWVKTGRSDFPV